jgi:hypothetical protein
MAADLEMIKESASTAAKLSTANRSSATDAASLVAATTYYALLNI